MLFEHQKLLVDKLISSGISPKEFNVLTDDSKILPLSGKGNVRFTATRFQVGDSQLHFTVLISNSYDSFRMYYSTFAPKFHEVPFFPSGGQPAVNIKHVIGHFETWLKEHVARYFNQINGENPWTKYNTNPFDSIPNFDNEEEMFNSKQVEFIQSAIKQLQEKVEKIESLTSEQKVILNLKLEMISDRAPKESKFNWVSFFGGTLQNIFANMLTPTETSGLIYGYVKELFSRLLLIG